MSGPWEYYSKQETTRDSGPWEKFSSEKTNKKDEVKPPEKKLDSVSGDWEETQGERFINDFKSPLRHIPEVKQIIPNAVNAFKEGIGTPEQFEKSTMGSFYKAGKGYIENKPELQEQARDQVYKNINQGINSVTGTASQLYNHPIDSAMQVGGAIYDSLGNLIKKPEIAIPKMVGGGIGTTLREPETLALPQVVSSGASALKPVVKAGMKAIEPVAQVGVNLGKAATLPVREIAAPITNKIGDAYRATFATEAPKLRSQAANIARSGVETDIQRLATESAEHLSAAEQLEANANMIDNHLQKLKTPDAHTSLEVQGANIRTALDNALSVGENKVAESNRGYQAMIKEDEATKALRGVSGRPPILGLDGKPTTVQDVLNELHVEQKTAFNANVLPKDQALATARVKELTEKLKEYTKDFKNSYESVSQEHGAAKKTLDFKTTATGKKVTGTEGGLTKEEYEKIPSSQIGNTVFKNSNSIQQFEDALAGGSGVKGEARVRAKKQVDQMLENHLMESLRGTPGKKALSDIAAPDAPSFYNRVPRVQSEMQYRATKEAEVAEFRQQAAERLKQMKTPAQLEDMRTELRKANSLLEGTSSKGKKEGLTKMMNVLGKTKMSMDSEQYRSALALIDRSQSMEERAARIQKILEWTGVGVSAIAGYETFKH